MKGNFFSNYILIDAGILSNSISHLDLNIFLFRKIIQFWIPAFLIEESKITVKEYDQFIDSDFNC